MRVAYLTLSDGTLVDFESEDRRGFLRVRAGHSLVPSERPVVFTLSPAEAVEFALELAGFTSWHDALRAMAGRGFAPETTPREAYALGAMAAELARHEAPLTLVLRSTLALQLAGLVQRALRHPAIGEGDECRRAGAMVLAHIRGYFREAPFVLHALDRGDDPDEVH